MKNSKIVLMMAVWSRTKRYSLLVIADSSKR